MRWEEQQRLFNDFDTSGKKVHSLDRKKTLVMGQNTIPMMMGGM